MCFHVLSESQKGLNLLELMARNGMLQKCLNIPFPFSLKKMHVDSAACWIVLEKRLENISRLTFMQNMPLGYYIFLEGIQWISPREDRLLPQFLKRVSACMRRHSCGLCLSMLVCMQVSQTLTYLFKSLKDCLL